MSERLNQRIKLALKDEKAAQELIDFLAALDPDGDGVAEAQADVDGILYGTATILNGATFATVTPGVAYNGQRVVVSFAEAPVAATKVWAGVVAAGAFTVNIDVNNTSDLDVNYSLRKP